MSVRLMAEDTVSRVLDAKIDEVLKRPEILAELESTVEQAVLARLPDAVTEAAKSRFSSYEAPFKPLVQKAVDRWVHDHAAEIAAKAEEFAAKAMEDPTVFQEVAKYQLSHYIGKIANDAVVRATQRQAKKAARVKKA